MYQQLKQKLEINLKTKIILSSDKFNTSNLIIKSLYILSIKTGIIRSK